MQVGSTGLVHKSYSNPLPLWNNRIFTPQVTQLYDRLNEIRQSTLSLFHKEITLNPQSLRIAHHKLKQNISAYLTSMR